MFVFLKLRFDKDPKPLIKLDANFVTLLLLLFLRDLRRSPGPNEKLPFQNSYTFLVLGTGVLYRSLC